MKDRSKFSSKIISILDWIGRIEALRSLFIGIGAASMIASLGQSKVDNILPYLQANSFPNIVVFVLIVSIFALSVVTVFDFKKIATITVYW